MPRFLGNIRLCSYISTLNSYALSLSGWTGDGRAPQFTTCREYAMGFRRSNWTIRPFMALAFLSAVYKVADKAIMFLHSLSNVLSQLVKTRSN